MKMSFSCCCWRLFEPYYFSSDIMLILSADMVNSMNEIDFKMLSSNIKLLVQVIMFLESLHSLAIIYRLGSKKCRKVPAYCSVVCNGYLILCVLLRRGPSLTFVLWCVHDFQLITSSSDFFSLMVDTTIYHKQMNLSELVYLVYCWWCHGVTAEAVEFT